MDWKSWMPKIDAASAGRTAWEWVAWAARGLWGSFWALWNNPMSYPVVAAIAVLTYSIGLGQGAHNVGLMQEQRDTYRAAAVSHQKRADELSAAVAARDKNIAALNEQVRAVPPPVMPVARTARVAPAAPKAVKPASSQAPGAWWPFKE